MSAEAEGLARAVEAFIAVAGAKVAVRFAAANALTEALKAYRAAHPRSEDLVT